MVRARCPFCGEGNEVGMFEEERAGEPMPWMKTCVHFVFFSPTRYPAIYYSEREFRVHVPGGSAAEAELLRTLNGYFRFVGPVAFAPSKETRERTHEAIEDFLKARKILTSGAARLIEGNPVAKRDQFRHLRGSAYAYPSQPPV